MLKLNVNGTVYENTDSCSIYNFSAQMLHAFDIYVMTSSLDAQNWLLTPNSDDTPKITIVMDRFPTAEDGQVFDIVAGLPGESFSNPIAYKRAGDVIDDDSYIQKLPSHNTQAQKNVKMLGGTNDPALMEQWGKTRISLPNNVLEPPGFFDERAEPYINMQTKDDFLKVQIVPSPTTNLSELDLFMQDIVIIIQPSQHERLRKGYMYYDTDNEPPRIEKTGVIY